jgi:hypothetical protein
MIIHCSTPGNPGASVDERAVDVEEGMSKAAATVGRFLVAWSAPKIPDICYGS